MLADLKSIFRIKNITYVYKPIIYIKIHALSISEQIYYAAIDFPHPISMSSQTQSDNVNPISWACKVIPYKLPLV